MTEACVPRAMYPALSAAVPAQLLYSLSLSLSLAGTAMGSSSTTTSSRGTASSRSRCRRAPHSTARSASGCETSSPKASRARSRSLTSTATRGSLGRTSRAGSASASACASRMTLRPAPPHRTGPHPRPAHEPRARLCAHGAERCTCVSWAGLGGRTWQGCWRGTRSPTQRKWTTMSLSSRMVRHSPGLISASVARPGHRSCI